jgi:outer membrane lipoprotein SlyB
MTTPINTLQPGQQPASSGNNKPLWAAIGILGAAVLAMGGTLLYKQNPPAPVATVAAVTTNAATTPQYPTARQLVAPAASANFADDLVEKPAAAAEKPKPAPAPAPVRHVSKPVHAPAPAPHYSGASPANVAPARVAAAPVCAVCGSVESVTPVERSAKPAGVGLGTVAGGVLGAVLGNQVGHGNGRTAATVLGAVGGGFAGNAIEGRMRTETVYQVGVRMEDGSRHMVEVAHAPGVGSPVTVDGSTLRTRDGATYSPQPRPVPVSAQPTDSPDYQGR